MCDKGGDGLSIQNSIPDERRQAVGLNTFTARWLEMREQMEQMVKETVFLPEDREAHESGYRAWLRAVGW
ncbi:MAG: hypothetical protein ACE5GK_11520 [Nitrospiria bacterium]